jgi:ABC-type branched-subunit amino acid transport system ATPase component
LEELVAGYDEVDVLRGVSLSVQPGDIVAIIGANGAGKSTLLRTVFGMVVPRAGRIRFAGSDIGGRPSVEVVRRGVGYVPQGRCNFPAMTVEENLEMGAYLRRDRQVGADIAALFTRFPVLADKRGAPAGTLSGGQQQILEMAMALLLHPRLLLVDEPSLGLDPRMVEVVFETILAINGEGTTILMVEQNAKKALSVSHRGFVLELGRNRFEGTGRMLLEDPDVRLHYLGG